MPRKIIILIVALFLIALVQLIYKLFELKAKNDQEMTELNKMKEQLAEMNKLTADSYYLITSDAITDSTVKLKTDGKVIRYELFNTTNSLNEQSDTLESAHILIPEFNHETPKELKETILKAIANYKHLNKLEFYSSMDSYYERIKNDAPASVAQITKKRKIIWEGFIGNFREGKYYENELE